MPWTPLHAALGETSTTFDFALIERACQERVVERADLDWKQKLPLTAPADQREARLNQKLELAKDIAAMANSGGGMIAYGIAEERTSGTSAANHVEPVGAVSEDQLKTIRQVAGNQIYPPVIGLVLLPIAPAERPADGVLVILVPDSPDTPHLIHPKNGDDWFGVPYRHGPETEWMVERQVSNAYQAREINRRRRMEDFEGRFEAFVQACGGGSGDPWVVALAVPEAPSQRPRDLTQGRAHRIIDAACNAPISGGFGPLGLTSHAETRRGLRSFNRIGRQTTSHGSPRARVEVHGDGAVAVGFTRAGAFPEGSLAGQVATTDLEESGLDLFALLWAARNKIGITGDYTARIAVVPPTQIFRRPDPVMVGYFVPFDETQRITSYLPVDGPILASAGLDPAMRSWVDMVSDAVAQAGAATVLDVSDLLSRQQHN